MNKDNGKSLNINAVDVFIILLILVCILSIAYRSVIIDEDAVASDQNEYRVYFKVDDIKSSSLKYFVAGDTVRIKSGGQTLGVLEGVIQHVPAVGAYNENGGEILYPEIEDQSVYNDTRYCISGYITVRGEMSNEGFFLNGEKYIAPNSTLEIITEHVETAIKIISITKK